MLENYYFRDRGGEGDGGGAVRERQKKVIVMFFMVYQYFFYINKSLHAFKTAQINQRVELRKYFQLSNAAKVEYSILVRILNINARQYYWMESILKTGES